MKAAFLLIACAAATLAVAAESRPSCCASAGAPAPAVSSTAPAPAPLSTRSVYQIEARWTNDAGERVSLEQLRGQPVVLAMFFASCEYACPILVHDLQRLRAALPPDVRANARFVLVSFDAARDTPAALRAYRERAQLDSDWTLLHGEEADVQELAMVLGMKYKQDARGQFSHTNLITVLNPAGEIAHQRTGLQGEVDTAARAVARATP